MLTAKASNREPSNSAQMPWPSATSRPWSVDWSDRCGPAASTPPAPECSRLQSTATDRRRPAAAGGRTPPR
jgi:hypothetical protein